MSEQSIGLLNGEKILQGLEVSAAVYLQQSSTALYVKLFVLIYVCLIRIGIYDNVVYVIHTCTPAQVYTTDHCPLKVLDNLVAPKDRVTDKVSMINV